MKKFYLMLAATAAFCFNASAQEVLTGQMEVGDFEGATETVIASYFDVAPTNFYLAHTGSQMIYTANDLADLVTDDTKTNVNITKLTYRYFNEGAWDDITRDIKFFIQPLEETEFQVVEGVKYFFNFDTTSPVVEFEATYMLLDNYGDDGLLEIDLANAPFKVTPGKGLLVTAVFDAQDDDNCTNGSDVTFYSTGLRYRAMTYTHNNIGFLDYTQSSDFPRATSILGCGTNIELPVTLIDYTYEEAEPSSIKEIAIENNEDGAYYNLMGQKLDGNNLPAGIYIHNGKKYIAK